MAQKIWYFDPSKPAVVPEILHGALEKHGIPLTEVKLCIMTDRSPDMVRCDSYLIATDTTIHVLSGTVTLRHKKGGIGKAAYKPEKSFDEISYTTHSLSDFEEFFTEEQIASVRMTGKLKAGGYLLLANSSNTYKPSVQSATKSSARNAAHDTSTRKAKSVRNAWTRTKSSAAPGYFF